MAKAKETNSPTEDVADQADDDETSSKSTQNPVLNTTGEGPVAPVDPVAEDAAKHENASPSKTNGTVSRDDSKINISRSETSDQPDGESQQKTEEEKDPTGVPERTQNGTDSTAGVMSKNGDEDSGVKRNHENCDQLMISTNKETDGSKVDVNKEKVSAYNEQQANESQSVGENKGNIDQFGHVQRCEENQAEDDGENDAEVVPKHSQEGNTSTKNGECNNGMATRTVAPALENPEQPTDTAIDEADKISEDIPATFDMSGTAASVAKGSDKVVTFNDDVKSENASVDADLPKSPTSTIRDLAASRQSERTSELVYDDSEDFPTPDFYDKAFQNSGTPSAAESEKLSRQESGTRRTLLSRGESNKSVTFADEINKDEGAEGDDAEDEEAELKAIEGEQVNTDEEESQGVFTTAVSEEKIEEATARAKKGISNTQSVAVDIWGQETYEIQTMGDVITKKATEHFEKGCKLADQGDHCHAILAFDKAINLCPKVVTYYLARGESYLQICDFQSAILNLKRACVLAPNNDKYYGKLAFVYYFYGQTLFDQHLFAEALEAFSRASEMRPEVVGYHTRSVACLAALQRHGECLALVNKRLDTEQDNPDLYIMRARLHELFRNTSLCYYDLKDALALNPDQEEAQMLMKQLEERAQESRNTSVSLQLQGKLKEALKKITTAIETNPSVAEYHLLRGALHRRLQDYNAAIDDYLLALDKTEHNEQDHIYTESQRQLLLTYNDFAVECFLGKHYEEAIILLNKALKGEKREKGLYINRGDCFFRLNELHFALADYHQALELDQSDRKIHSRIASIHSEFGLLDYEEQSYQEADARFTVAIQHNPRMGAYYVYRAKVRFMLENQPDARQDLLMALHFDPNNDDILSLMPRLFPGKSVGDVMRSKAARTAKIAVENAVVKASPVKLPEINRDSGNKVSDGIQGESKVNGTAKQVAFTSDGGPPQQELSMPDIQQCMDEIQFNRMLSKNKKKISDHVKTVLNDRKSLANGAPVTLAPQPPPRPYTIKGGGWKKGEEERPQGWRTFSLGMGIMNK